MTSDPRLTTVLPRGVVLRDPILLASGCCGYGEEYSDIVDPASIGGVITKAVSPEPRLGNPLPRLRETPAGLLNCIGLQNPGVEKFAGEILPNLLSKGITVMVNVVGKKVEDFADVVRQIEASETGARTSRPQSQDRHKGSYHRGRLPHFDDPHLIQHVTFRLADSLPKERLLDLKEITQDQELIDEKVNTWLDAGVGECLLRDPRVAEIVVRSLKHFDGERYDLIAWVVMPNHVHVSFKPRSGFPLSEIVKAWKSYTAHEINRTLSRSGTVWQPDFFDRFVRDESHLARIIDYIHWNPVSASLVENPEDYPYSSYTEFLARNGGIARDPYADDDVRAPVAMAGYELDLSCPNVESGTMFATDAALLTETVAACRAHTAQLIVAKLSPNVTDIVPYAAAALAGGADAVTISNTYNGISIDIRTRQSHLGRPSAGLSGGAIRPAVLYHVWRCHRALPQLPILGSGGITDVDSAVQFLLAGATALQLGTGMFVNPALPREVQLGLSRYLDEQGQSRIGDIVGGYKA